MCVLVCERGRERNMRVYEYGFQSTAHMSSVQQYCMSIFSRKQPKFILCPIHYYTIRLLTLLIIWTTPPTHPLSHIEMPGGLDIYLGASLHWPVHPGHAVWASWSAPQPLRMLLVGTYNGPRMLTATFQSKAGLLVPELLLLHTNSTPNLLTEHRPFSLAMVRCV